MEYLRQQFHSELEASIETNSESDVKNIVFGNVEFPVYKVLQTFDPIAYDEAFEGWLQIRKERLSDKAEEILDVYPSNRGRFNALKEIYKHGAAIPFIGAGMSITSGYPGWTNFLRRLRNETEITEGELENLLSNGQYEEAAQLLAEAMPNNSFSEQLEMYFSAENSLAGPVQYLPRVFNTAVITTNFDTVVQRCYMGQNKTFSDTFIGIDATEIRRYLGQGARILIKLHGRALSANGRVLTLNEYEHHYGLGNVIPSVIDAICVKTLLFIGCSLTTDRTVRALEQIAIQQQGAAVRHYAFLPLENETLRVERSNALARANIFPIWYPGDADHDEIIESLLLKLQED